MFAFSTEIFFFFLNFPLTYFQKPCSPVPVSSFSTQSCPLTTELLLDLVQLGAQVCGGTPVSAPLLPALQLPLHLLPLLLHLRLRESAHVPFVSLFLQEEIPRQLQYICLYLIHIAGAYLLK